MCRDNKCQHFVKGHNKTLNDYYKEIFAIVQERGGKLESQEYIKSSTRMKIRCYLDHPFERSRTQLINGSWCKKCKEVDVLNMMRKKATERGGKLLSIKYIRSDSYYKWECEKGHQWEAVWSNVQRDRWCPYCAGRSVIDDLCKEAHTRGGRLLSTEYTKGTDYYEWECGKGHRWKAVWYNVKRGRWCPYCCGRTETKDLIAYAEKRGGKLISPTYIKRVARYEWECELGHRFMKTWACMKQYGSWCTVCSGHAPPPIEELQEKAYEKGGVLLSAEYINARTLYFWMCEKGHKWWSLWGDIKNDRWCPHCSHVARLTTEEMQKEAALRGGKFVSEQYMNCRTLHEWECEVGHRFWRKWSSIKGGKWCKECNRKESIGEQKIRLFCERHGLQYAKEFTSEEITPKRYDFYITDGRKVWLVEFDGEQHIRRRTQFGMSEEKFLYRQSVDRFKTLTAWIMNVTLIRIDYSQINHIDEHMEKALAYDGPVYYSTPSLYEYISQGSLTYDEMTYHSASLLEHYINELNEGVIPDGIPKLINHNIEDSSSVEDPAPTKKVPKLLVYKTRPAPA